MATGSSTGSGTPSPTPEPDLARIVEVFDRHGVEYLIVGGHAARAYGATRPTQDTDCLVKTGDGNLARVAAALKELHARLRVTGLSDEEAASLPIQIDAILEQFDFSNWRTDAGDLDIMTTMPDRTGARCRYTDFVDGAQALDYAGVRIHVASLNAIVASKEFANRPKDRDALPELHRLQEQTREARHGCSSTAPLVELSPPPHHLGYQAEQNKRIEPSSLG